MSSGNEPTARAATGHWIAFSSGAFSQKLTQIRASLLVSGVLTYLKGAPPPNSWKWGDLSCREIKPGKAIIGLFSHVVSASRAGKEALKQLLGKLRLSHSD
jgi:hypothetical protein